MGPIGPGPLGPTNEWAQVGTPRLGGFLKDFFLGFENMGDMGWAGNALFGPWGGVTWAQLRYAGDGDSQFAWGGHEKAEKRDRV